MGGALYSVGGEVWATNCLFKANTCYGGAGTQSTSGYTTKGGNVMGGAIFCTNSQVRLERCLAIENAAIAGRTSAGRPGSPGGFAAGGAMATEESAGSLSDCTFRRNSVRGDTQFLMQGGEAQGGGLYLGTGSMSVIGTLVAECSAEGGTGLTRSISGTAAPALGGGIFNSGELLLSGSVVVSNRTIGGPGNPTGIDPGSALGGGIYSSGELRLINSTLVGNAAEGGSGEVDYTPTAGTALGGGLHCSGGGAALVYVTIASNIVQGSVRSIWWPAPHEPVSLGASVYVTNSNVTLTNTLLACSAGPGNVTGAVDDGGNNLCSDASAGFTKSTSHDATDPRLNPLTWREPDLPFLSLQPVSPAIGAAVLLDGVLRDQRGMVRPQGATPDIGAVEFVPTLKLQRNDASGRILTGELPPTSPYWVEKSTNLVDWAELSTGVTPTNGTIRITEPESRETARAFYRLRL